MNYRLGLDIGTNSIGWCVLRLEGENPPKPVGIIDAGVRIFSDGRSGKNKDALSNPSKAVDRREKRQQRRRRDRFLRRKARLQRVLLEHGLLPGDEAAFQALARLDPYELRARGLREELSPHELGRALLHINQHRGFKSNRKTDKKDKEQGKIESAGERLAAAMDRVGVETLGAFLWERHSVREPVKARLQGKGAEAAYAFYPHREMVEREVDLLFERQARYHPFLIDELRNEVKDVLLFQRPLRKPRPGRCLFEPEEDRAPRALPSAQRFRIYQDLNHLQLITPQRQALPLRKDQRDLLARKLLLQKRLKFDAMRKALGLNSEWTFNFESEKRDGLDGDLTASVLASAKGVGKSWRELPLADQDKIVELLLDTEDERELIDALVKGWGWAEEMARRASDAMLPEGYVSLGPTALSRILEQLQAKVVSYAEAVKAVYPHHSHFDTGEILERLPYYGLALSRHVIPGDNHPAAHAADKFGRISNPTVHIGLNQVRRVVNELIERHGHPAQIVVELARDLKRSRRERNEISRDQAINQAANEERKARIRELGCQVSGEAITRMRLWEELAENPAQRVCPYTGEQISLAMLLTPEVEIDHVLPFSRTLDDSLANKTVCLSRANRYKSNRSPFEAFGKSLDGYEWDNILPRAKRMPRNKAWRFAPEAMNRFGDEEGFLDRQLADTRYLSRMVREYLSRVCDPRQIWVTPGRLTRLLAHCWGLPEKDRNLHVHHAMDAAVIAVIDRSLLKGVGTIRAREEEAGLEEFLRGFRSPPDWPGFRGELMETLLRMVVSHRPDHGLGGRLHEETAYGVVQEGDKNAVRRVELSSLSSLGDIKAVRDKNLRARLLAHATGVEFERVSEALQQADALPEREGKALLKSLALVGESAMAEAMRSFEERYGVRRVRCLENQSLVRVRHGSTGQHVKGYKSGNNAYLDIYESAGKWVGRVVSVYEASTRGFVAEEERQGLPLVMRLFKGDMLEIEDKGRRITGVVTEMTQSGQFYVAGSWEANVAQRFRENDPNLTRISLRPETLRKRGGRPVYVSPAGRVFYPRMPRRAAAHS